MTAAVDVFPAPVTARLRTLDGRAYPVARIFCASHNYLADDHAGHGREEREPLHYFTKFPDALVNADPADRLSVPYPSETANYHCGVELVAAIGLAGFRISPDQARQHIWGYACGLDMTRRDLQREARDTGRPWDAGKNLEQSCPTGRLVPAERVGDMGSGAIRLSVNDALCQSADVSRLIWSAAELISDLSLFYHLRPGDLVFTGTPAGGGVVEPGDRIKGSIAGLPPVRLRIDDPL